MCQLVKLLTLRFTHVKHSRSYFKAKFMSLGCGRITAQFYKLCLYVAVIQYHVQTTAGTVVPIKFKAQG